MSLSYGFLCYVQWEWESLFVLLYFLHFGVVDLIFVKLGSCSRLKHIPFLVGSAIRECVFVLWLLMLCSMRMGVFVCITLFFTFRCCRPHLCKAGYSFSHRVLPTVGFDEASWGLSTMVLFRQNHMNYPRNHLSFDLFGEF